MRSARFADLLRARGIARYYTYPKTPEMIAHAERFNRTVQEEFLDHHEDLLWGDEANLAALNRKLAEWLLWYTGSARMRPWPSGPRSPRSPGSARCSTTSPDRRRPEPQYRRHPLPASRTGRAPSSMKKCQVHWARTHSLTSGLNPTMLGISGRGHLGHPILSCTRRCCAVKKSETPPTEPPPAEKKPDTIRRLHLRRRSVAVLTDKEMDGVAGGHPHNTCEPTCPATCCPTCPATCPAGCEPPTNNYEDTCDTCDTCDGSCLDSCVC